MWTPRRILLGLCGLLVFAAGYFAYARGLGSLDGLPPLPHDFYPGPPGVLPAIERTPTTPTYRNFEMAFGQGCPELYWKIRLDLKARRVLIAAQDYEIIKDGPRAGWVAMWPLSIASLGQKRAADGIREINVLYCDKAYLKFDKPVRNIGDFDGRKIVAAELHADQEAQVSDPRKGRVRVVNNRRTLDPNDDIDLVTPGPVIYEDSPRKGQPHIYTSSTVHVTDHLNTGLPQPNRKEPRPPTVTGVGLRVFLTPEDERQKKGPQKKDEPRLPIPRRERNPGVSGVELVELDKEVEMNLWTDADASFVAPGGKGKEPKANPPRKGELKKDPKAVEKRRLTVRTNGPFRYDLNKELAHFEKPANPRPGLIEQVTVTREGRTTGEDMLLCEYLDVQFRRKKPAPADKDAPRKDDPPPAKKDGGKAGDGDLEIKSIRAWGETVVVTSDSENMQATGAELTHDADAHITILKGNGAQRVQAVKDGTLLRGSELHLYGDGKEISHAHVLGAGSVGLGELDPETGEYLKQAFWQDRMVFTKEPRGKDLPPLDVITFFGKDGARARFQDTTGGQLQQIEADQLRVKLAPAEPRKDGKGGPKKDPPARGDQKKDAKKDVTGAVKPIRLEAIGHVSSTSPELIIKHADSLDTSIKDVPELIKPPADPKDGPKAKDGKGPTAVVRGEPGKGPVEPKTGPVDRKAGPVAKKDVPKEEAKEKKPLVVSAQTIKARVNRDPQGKTEMEWVHAAGDVEAHQDPATKDELGTDIAGQTVEMESYREGNRLTVRGVPSQDKAPHKWGVVRFDKLTMFGFDIVIDQRDNTSNVKGEGSMEIVSGTDLEGKKLEQPTTVRVYWKHRMDFRGGEKLIDYHGGVQAYQEDSRLKCEWMQVLLDRPIYLSQALKPKEPAKQPKVGEQKERDNPNIDTVMCFHAPKDEDVPKPRTAQPVSVIQEEKVGDRVVRFQSIQAPDVVTVNTPVEGGKARKDLTATSSDTMPGTVRIWQPGQKDGLADRPPKKDGPPGKAPPPPKKKGDLGADQEMQLTVVQFAGKMIANDFRKRAKFFTNVRTVHLPADSPTIPVDLREGEIPPGAVYLEARDWLEVFSTEQMEKNPKTGKTEPVGYQEMTAVGNVRVSKQGEFVGDADRVMYSELKGTLTFKGTEKNPAIVNKLEGQGLKPKPMEGETIIYYVKTKTFEVIKARRLGQ